MIKPGKNITVTIPNNFERKAIEKINSIIDAIKSRPPKTGG